MNKSLRGPLCVNCSAQLAMKCVCQSISAWPAEGTLNTSALLQQRQMMQKHSVHPRSRRALWAAVWNSRKYRKYGLYRRVSFGKLCVESTMEGRTHCLSYWSSAHWSFPRTSVQGRNFLQVRVYFSNNLAVCFLFCIYSSVWKPKATEQRMLCPTSFRGRRKLSEMLRSELPFQESGCIASFLPGRALGKYCASFCYGELTRLRLCYEGERVFLLAEI